MLFPDEVSLETQHLLCSVKRGHVPLLLLYTWIIFQTFYIQIYSILTDLLQRPLFTNIVQLFLSLSDHRCIHTFQYFWFILFINTLGQTGLERTS